MNREMRAAALGSLHSVSRVMRMAAQRGVQKANDYATKRVGEARDALGPVTPANWYSRAAASCEAVGDAIFNKPGTTHRIVKAFAGKIGFLGVPAVLFSTAAILGSASTGTAIGSLTGAAFTSAALAWLGGSVAVGSVLVTIGSIAGGVGAAFGAGWAAKKYLLGKKRDRSEFDEQEARIVDASLALAVAFRNEEKAGHAIEPAVAKALYNDALEPLCGELLAYRLKAEGFPPLARKRFRNAKDRLETVASFVLDVAQKHPNSTTGIVGAVVIQLLADDIPAFDENEHLVLDALRRSKGSLHDATPEDLAAYVQSLEPSQLRGMTNNVLGIYHELRFGVKENSDGDQYVVEIFEDTNHPGADVRITNTLTGDVREVQLKASNYRSYIERHMERYTDIPVMTTDEVADEIDGVASTGMSHEELTEDVDSVVSGLHDAEALGVLTSMSVAGMISVSKNVSVLLERGAVSQAKKRALVRDSTASALIAGLVHTVIG